MPKLSMRTAAPEAGAYSIEQFCQAHSLSYSYYFKLKKQGLGPKEFKVGQRRLVSMEAAQKWREEREAAS